MSTQHTLGPWTVDAEATQGALWIRPPYPKRRAVCLLGDLQRLRPRERADAALIAAAPDLLALLIEARKDLPIAAVGWNTRDSEDEEDRTMADFHVSRVLELMKRVDAAIARATGSAS